MSNLTLDHALPIARMEATARWRVARVGHFATERRVHRHIRIGIGHGRQQGAGVGVLGVAEQTGRLAQLGDLADVDYRDPLADVLDYAQVVR